MRNSVPIVCEKQCRQRLLPPACRHIIAVRNSLEAARIHQKVDERQFRRRMRFEAGVHFHYVCRYSAIWSQLYANPMQNNKRSGYFNQER